MFTKRLTRFIAVGVAAGAIGGGTYGIVGATASNATVVAAPGSNARSGPAAGGAVGTVRSVSAPSFTIVTPAGQKVTVKSSRAVKRGQSVLVLGTVSGTTIAATQVIVHKASSATTVVPFEPGSASTSKQVGRIPANYTQGSGTIVGGAAADKATEAALAAYPGGIVDRVVRLSNGEYEVHNIGVNWPHHIFVTKTFQVAGAD